MKPSKKLLTEIGQLETNSHISNYYKVKKILSKNERNFFFFKQNFQKKSSII